MSKIAFSGVLALVLWVISGSCLWADAPEKQDKLTIQTSQGNIDFTIEIAQTQQQKEQGLMHRTKLGANHGMLFLWAEDTSVRMWMKDTLLSLDMLFLDAHGKIIYIAQNTTPNSLSIIDPKMPARAVLEVAAGTSATNGIKPGDRVVYSYFAP